MAGRAEDSGAGWGGTGVLLSLLSASTFSTSGSLA